MCVCIYIYIYTHACRSGGFWALPVDAARNGSNNNNVCIDNDVMLNDNSNNETKSNSNSNSSSNSIEDGAARQIIHMERIEQSRRIAKT